MSDWEKHIGRKLDIYSSDKGGCVGVLLNVEEYDDMIFLKVGELYFNAKQITCFRVMTV